jgi:hypothetical protein
MFFGPCWKMHQPTYIYSSILMEEEEEEEEVRK